MVITDGYNNLWVHDINREQQRRRGEDRLKGSMVIPANEVPDFLRALEAASSDGETT